MNRFDFTKIDLSLFVVFHGTLAIILSQIYSIELLTISYLFVFIFFSILCYISKYLLIEDRFNKFFSKGTIITRATSARLILLDVEGKRARYTKEKEITTNAPSLDKYTEFGIWSQGPLENIEVSDNITCTPRPESDRENHYDLDFYFKTPLLKKQIRDISVSWTSKDSYINDTEYFTVNFSHPSNMYTLRIIFPEARPVKEAWVDFTYLGEKTSITEKNLHISHDRLELLFTMNQVFPGMKAMVIWNW